MPHRDRKDITNPILKHSLKIWDSVCDSGGLRSLHTPLLQVLHNPSFSPGLDNSASFRVWQEKDLTSLYKLTNVLGMKLFPELQRDYNLPNSEIFRYLQLKSYIDQITPHGGSSSPLMTWFERRCRDDPHVRSMITGIYSDIRSGPSRYDP